MRQTHIKQQPRKAKSVLFLYVLILCLLWIAEITYVCSVCTLTSAVGRGAADVSSPGRQSERR